MIYINIDDNYVAIPKHTLARYDDYDLYITNLLTQKVVIYREVVDVTNDNNEYYSFNINTTLLDDNSEYQYNLMKKKILVETGLMRVGNFESTNNVQYESENNDTIVYGG